MGVLWYDPYKDHLRAIRQAPRQRAMKLPRSVSKDLSGFTLYDVFVWGDWDTNRDAYYGIPIEERSTKRSASNARKEQVLAMVEEAMDLAGHRPAKAAAATFPRNSV